MLAVRSDTHSEGSGSTSDDYKRSGGEVKRNRSLKSLRLRKQDGGGDDESGLLDKLRSTMSVGSAEKFKKRTDKKKQKDEVSKVGSYATALVMIYIVRCLFSGEAD